MLKLVFCLLFISSAFAEKLTLDERRKQILSIVDEELSEVTRLAKQQNYSSPESVLRIAELNMEKARLWREVENEGYLSIPPEKRRGQNKSSFFSKSTVYFEAANDAAHIVTKRFPRYKGMGDVFYILAYNNKELGNNKEAQKYFGLSAKKATSGSNIAAKSKLSLADYHFNAHEFKKAVPLYESALSVVNDKWWTKDAFNLAWSYYRVHRYDKAINLMLDIHKKSKSDKYINMQSMVERDIAIFYVDSDRMADAIKFYESIGSNYTEQFVKIANAITIQGRFTQAEALLERAAKYEKYKSKRAEILFAQLDLFDKYNKVSPHLKASNELVSYFEQKLLDEDQVKRLIYHVNKKAAELQKVMVKGTYQGVPKAKKEKTEQAFSYFQLAAILEPKRTGETVFYQAETYYASGEYAKAIATYQKSFDQAKINGDKKIMSQSIEGMLSSLSQPGLENKQKEGLYVPVYNRYLIHDQKSERAKSIYVKLFNVHYDSKYMNEAESTLASFAKDFPQDYKTQEGMLAKVMEYYREKKNYGKVKSYVVDINSGKYKVSKKYADALRSLMTKIQIEGVQESLEKGEKDVALKGYHKIYESSESTPKAKVNAAYNLSALYYELGDANQSYLWAVTAVKDMTPVEVVKFSDSYLSISAGLFLKQNFAQSADLSHRILAKLCKENSSNKNVAFKNAVYISLANNELDKAIEIRETGKTCLIADSTISEVTFEILKELRVHKRWEKYEELISELERNSKNFPLLIKPYEDLSKVYESLGDNEKAKEIFSKQMMYYSQSKAQKLEIPVEALDLIAFRLVNEVIEKRNVLDKIQLSFPENEFNNAVKSKLQLLDKMATQVNEIQKIGSGRAIVESYRNVITAYEEFGNSLKMFTPEGKAPEYVASFQKAMSEVYLPILNTARKLRGEVKSLIVKNKILSLSNFSVLMSEEESFKRFYTVKEAVLMERGGKR